MSEAYNYGEIIALTYTLIEEVEKLKAESVLKESECLLNEKICMMHHHHGGSEAYLRAIGLIKCFVNVLELRKS